MTTRFQITTIATSIIPRCWLAAVGLLPLLVPQPALCATDTDYVAHEWGTFTSIQGGDGVLLGWNGIATSDLPPFVHDWARPGLNRISPLLLTKGGIRCIQRMETPVIYFYPRRPMTVDVAVQFPLGKITEWFPQAAGFGPSSGRDVSVTNSFIRWEGVELLPAEQNSGLARQLPAAAKASHYFAARTAGAAFVRADSLVKSNPAPEIEKFLFYRGVGNFQTPLRVTMDGLGQMTLTNTGVAPLKHLVAVVMHSGRATFLPLGDLDAGRSRVAQLDETGVGLAGEATGELGMRMVDALVAEGLYRDEARAMVATWRDAWFEEEGVRVLYLLPRAWTDSILPITLTPEPRELVRVMVGRAELITPTMGRKVAECITRFRQPDPDGKRAAVREFRAMKLGRFAEVAVRMAASRSGDAAFYPDALKLMNEAAKLESGQSENQNVKTEIQKGAGQNSSRVAQN